MNDNAKQLILDNLDSLKKLAKHAKSNQREEIDILRIIYFLTQFQSEEKIKIIIALLQKIDYLDSAKITALLKKAYDKIEPALLHKPMIIGLGSIQDSSAVICYQLLKELFDNENETLDLVAHIDAIEGKILANKPSSIILVDDNITSGTQLSDFFEEMIAGKENPEFFKKPISKEAYLVLQEIPIRICYAIQLAESSNNVIEKIKEKYNLDVKFYWGKVDYNNYLDFESNVFDNQNDSDFAKKFITEIAVELYADKKWSRENVYNRVLGYGNLGKLTAFYYNVPKSLIPIFWKFGQYDGKPWIPLFPESQESKKIKAANADMDYMSVQAIKGWLASGLNNRAPKLLFAFLVQGGIRDEITLEIPSKAYIQEEFIQKIKIKPATYIQNVVPTQPRVRLHLFNDRSLKKTLAANDYQKYKDAVDLYNSELTQYLEDLEEYIYRLSSTKKVDVILANQGDMSASNYMVKLNFNTSLITINHIRDFEPSFEKVVPNINDFYTRQIAMVEHQFDYLTFNPLIIQKRKPYLFGSNYPEKFDGDRINQNDDKTFTIDLTRMNTTQKRFELHYDLNYQEERETQNGQIVINYNEVDNIDSELRERIERLIKKLK